MASAVDLNGRYTYADYLNWSDDERWEIINGYPYNMSPAPSRRHQEVLGKLYRRVADYFDHKPCQVYIAPFDIRLAEDQSDDHLIDNVVQPDLSVFCDRSKLDDKGAHGAPDLVVEVLSPSTMAKDLKSKLLLYQQFGVKEYWLVNTALNTVEVLTLDPTGKYTPGKQYDMHDTLTSPTFDGLSISLNPIFQNS